MMNSSAVTRVPQIIRTPPSPAVLGRWLLLGALIAGISYRLIGLSAIPLIWDESVIVEMSRAPLAQVYEMNKVVNSAPPLCVLILHFVLRIGDSEWAVRLLSFITGVLLIAAMYFAGKQVWMALPGADEEKAALCGGIAAALCALAPSQMVVSRQIRVYSFGALLTAVALVLALQFWRKPTAMRAAALGAVMFAGLQVQYGPAFFYLGLFAAILIARLQASLSRKRFLALAAIVGGMFAAGVGVVYATSLRFQFYPGRGSAYAPTLGNTGPMKAVARSVIGLWRLLEYSYPSDLFALLVLVGLGIVFFRQRLNPVLTTTLVSTLAVMAASVMNLYLFGGTRQCLFLSVPLYACAAVAAVSVLQYVPSRHQIYAITCITLVLAAPAALDAAWVVHRIRQDPNFKTAMAVLDREYKTGDIVFVSPGAVATYRYYAPRYAPKPWIQAASAYVADERYGFYRGFIGQEPPYLEQLNKLLASGKRVWLLYSHYYTYEPHFRELSDAHGWSNRVRYLIAQDANDLTEGVSLILYE